MSILIKSFCSSASDRRGISHALLNVQNEHLPKAIENRAALENKRQLKEKRLEKERRELYELVTVLFSEKSISKNTTLKSEFKNAGNEDVVKKGILLGRENSQKKLNHVALMVINRYEGKRNHSFPLKDIPGDVFFNIMKFLELKYQIKFGLLSKECFALALKSIKIDLYFSKIYQRKLTISNFCLSGQGQLALTDRVVKLLLGFMLETSLAYISPISIITAGIIMGLFNIATFHTYKDQFVGWISLKEDYCDWKKKRPSELMSFPKEFENDPFLSGNRCYLTNTIVRFPVRDKQHHLFELQVILAEIQKIFKHSLRLADISDRISLLREELVLDQDLCIKIHERISELEQQNGYN